ncbi:trypsin-1-like [Eriocheir sinensis]|uniref:trypsin-1-like n=1 Tax=Eriocheir sinensis TaxID=95602 RepID=UPI0021CAB425|nr:trypsin-1-like [Eriocheir sinensis]
MKACAWLLYVWAALCTCVGVHGGLFTRDLDRPDRIVGGEPVKEGALPWQVSLQMGNHHFCGGTLVAKDLVVTAAHCTIDFDMSEVRVLTGAWDLRKKHAYRHHRIVKVSMGPYNSDTLQNDIALLWIEEEMRTASNNDLPHGSPVSIETRKETNRGQRCTISGWGRVSSGGDLPNVLLAADVQVQDDEACQKIFSDQTFFSIFPSNLCAGGGARDACQGDSGGPLVCCEDSSNIESCHLAGITSWGIGCATKGIPGVYTEVAYFTDWIKEEAKTRNNGRDLKTLKFYPS